jgi:RNA polymerase sigma-B factor
MGNGIAAVAVQADEGAVHRHGGESDRRLFERYRYEGDTLAREELIARFLPLARRLARRYWWGRDQAEDLVQVASIGLLKAIDRFDHERGVAFTSYAVPTIVGELKRHLRDTRWALHVPQRLQERALEVDRAAEGLRVRLGRSPTAHEVAELTGLTADGVAEATGAASAFNTVSLDWRPHDSERDRGAGIGNVLAFEDERFDLIEHGATIQPALDAMPARDRMILRMRFDMDMTQSEIGERLGLSQMHVSRLLRRALGRLRVAALARAA